MTLHRLVRLDELERLRAIEHAARELVAAWELAERRELVGAALLAQLRYALALRGAEPPPSTGGAAPDAA